MKELLFKILDKQAESRAIRRLSSFLKINAPRVLRKFIWDYEFSRGMWDYLDPEGVKNPDPTFCFVEKYANKGFVLDLGCGTGRLLRELDSSKFLKYTGVDISEVAIQDAKAKCQDFDYLSEKADFIVADILEFLPEWNYDVIIYQECLYYLKKNQINKTIEKYSNHLTNNGVMIFRFHDQALYGWIINLIRAKLKIIEQYSPDNSSDIILIGKPNVTTDTGRTRQKF